MIITQTPLRVSFVGGGTDLPSFFLGHDGAVVSTTIDKYFYVIVKERCDDKIYLNYSKKEIVDTIDQIEHELIREAMRKAGVTRGVEIVTLSDIPSEGSGLGSSSAVLVGLLNALYAFRGRQQPASVLAKEAAEIEIEILKKPIGYQDHYAAAFGGLNLIKFLRSGVTEVHPITVPIDRLRALSSRLLLFYTGITRSASTILSAQQREMTDHTSHYLRMRDQAHIAAEELTQGRIHALGELLHEGWTMKRELSARISNPEIDAMYDAGRQAGALGGKLLGAGGGGFLLLYTPLEAQNAVRDALRHYREMPVRLEPDGSKVIFNVKRYHHLWM